jgi:ribA/ribD-fused uncharacterized protein
MNDILDFRGENKWLSNFALVDIMFDRVIYPTTEAAYVSQKDKDNLVWRAFCSDRNNSPGKVMREGRKIKLPDDWETRKRSVMYKALFQKFTQEPYKQMLIDTGDCYLMEGNTWHDIYWGVDLYTGIGENNLGKMIMEIRKIISVESGNQYL